MPLTQWLLCSLLLLGVVVPSAATPPIEEAGDALVRCREAAGRQSFEEAAALAEEAEAAFQGVLEEDPGAVEARLDLARALMECRIPGASMMERAQLMGAIEGHLGAALEADPEHWEARYLYGSFLYHVPPFLGRTDDAVEHLETLLAQERRAGSHRSPEPFVILGELYARRDEPAKARATWREGLKAFPESEALRDRLEEAGEPEEEPEDGSGGPGAAGAVGPASEPREPGPDSQAPAGPEAAAEPGAPKDRPEAGGDLAERLRRRIREEVARPEIVGVAVALERDGRPILVDGFGLADLENRVPATPRTVFRIGSITKQFTAAAVLRLAQEGRLGLDDPLSRWLPETGDRGDVPLRAVLSHTAGLPPEAADSGRWVRDSLAAPRVGRPGEHYAYSNLGYGLLGLVVERASGLSWARFLKERFFTPLGMDATRPCDPVAIIPWRAEGYAWQGDRLVNDAPLRFGPSLLPAGGLCSTAEDLLAWQRALHGGDLLEPGSYRQMTTPPEVASEEGTTYAFGLRLHAPRGRRVIHHSGGISGFLSELAYYPEEGLSAVVLTNSEASRPRELGYELAELVLGPPAARQAGSARPR